MLLQYFLILFIVRQNLQRLSYILVITDMILYHTLLHVITFHQLVGQYIGNLFLENIQIPINRVSETILQLLYLTGHLIIVFLVLSCLYQSFQNKLGGCLVCKLTLFQVFLELGQQFIRQNKFRRSCNRGMSCRIFINKIKDHILQHQFLGYFSVFLRFNLHVRRDTTTVLHRSPSFRFKGFH